MTRRTRGTSRASPGRRRATKETFLETKKRFGATAHLLVPATPAALPPRPGVSGVGGQAVLVFPLFHDRGGGARLRVLPRTRAHAANEAGKANAVLPQKAKKRKLTRTRGDRAFPANGEDHVSRRLQKKAHVLFFDSKTTVWCYRINPARNAIRARALKIKLTRRLSGEVRQTCCD